MEIRSIAEVIGIIGLLVLGGINIYDTDIDPYYCESRAIVMTCDRLSDSTKTCYNTEVGNKRCTDGWIQLEHIEKEKQEPLTLELCEQGYYCVNGIKVRK